MTLNSLHTSSEVVSFIMPLSMTAVVPTKTVSTMTTHDSSCAHRHAKTDNRYDSDIQKNPENNPEQDASARY